MSVTILLGAEGCSEAAEAKIPWLREATPEEIEGLGDCRNLDLDKTGRPYFFMTITDDAPEEVLSKFKNTLRTVRL
jgi:hypothetical protein